MTSTSTWPEGVIARHLTAAGIALADRDITVDITGRQTESGDLRAACRGCGRSWSHNYEPSIQQWARDHAEDCRALPRPA